MIAVYSGQTMYPIVKAYNLTACGGSTHRQSGMLLLLTGPQLTVRFSPESVRVPARMTLSWHVPLFKDGHY